MPGELAGTGAGALPLLALWLLGVSLGPARLAHVHRELEQLVEVIMTQMRAVALDGPAAAELDRAKAQLKASLLMSLESSEARAAQIARDTLIFGRQLSPEELIERIDSVSAADVGGLAAGFALARDPVIASVGPEGVSERFREAVLEERHVRQTIH